MITILQKSLAIFLEQAVGDNITSANCYNDCIQTFAEYRKYVETSFLYFSSQAELITSSSYQILFSESKILIFFSLKSKTDVSKTAKTVANFEEQDKQGTFHMIFTTQKGSRFFAWNC